MGGAGERMSSSAVPPPRFADGELAGFISAARQGGYWLQTGGEDYDDASWFINEFVVSPEYRGKRIGVNLTRASIDPELGIFGVRPDAREMYASSIPWRTEWHIACVWSAALGAHPLGPSKAGTFRLLPSSFSSRLCRYTTVHSHNVTSRTAFIKGGYQEVSHAPPRPSARHPPRAPPPQALRPARPTQVPRQGLRRSVSRALSQPSRSACCRNRNDSLSGRRRERRLPAGT